MSLLSAPVPRPRLQCPRSTMPRLSPDTIDAQAGKVAWRTPSRQQAVLSIGLCDHATNYGERESAGKSRLFSSYRAIENVVPVSEPFLRMGQEPTGVRQSRFEFPKSLENIRHGLPTGDLTAPSSTLPRPVPVPTRVPRYPDQTLHARFQRGPTQRVSERMVAWRNLPSASLEPL
jgi:hypothetical protein